MSRLLGGCALALALWLAAAPPAGASAWLDAPVDAGGLDSLLAPPSRPLGGRDLEQDPTLSPDGRWLVYAAQVDGNWDLWLRDLEAPPGQPARRLTRHVAEDRRPAFSPDGSALVFVSHREDAAGDIWRLPLRRFAGHPRPGREEALLRRPGAQDNPALDERGGLCWDEESPAGRRVMRRNRGGVVTTLACPASLPRPGHGGLYVAALPDSQAARVDWLPDSLLEVPGAAWTVVWRPAGPLLDARPGPDGRLWAATLEEGGVMRPGQDLATPSQLWLLTPGVRKPPRPLLEEGRAPRQLALGGKRMVYTEDARPSLLWLGNPEGRFAPAGAPLDPLALLELARRFAGNELGVPILQTVQAERPGTPEADRAALEEFRLRLRRGEPLPLLRERAAFLADWLGAPEAKARLSALALQAELAADPRRDADELDRPLAEARRGAWPGAVAEALTGKARVEMLRGKPERALAALLGLEALPDSLPEQADGLAWRVAAYESLGQPQAARGALARLAERHGDRPDLLADWLRRDLARLEGLGDERARLRLRERLVDLGAIAPLRLALSVELAAREAEAGEDGRRVALEDLRTVLRVSPARLGPFERRAWTQGTRLEADLMRQAGQLESALGRLAAGDDSLRAADEPALAGILRARRIDWLLERARAAGREEDWAPVAADCRLILSLDPLETRAWRLGLAAEARLGRLDEVEAGLRGRLEGKSASQTLRGEALARRAVDSWALGLLLSWRAETDAGQLAESDDWLERALELDDRLAPACLTLSFNLGRELQLAEGRPGGLKGLARELGRSGETLGRVRRRGLGGLRDPDEEALRDRAILLSQRGLRWTDRAGDPELGAALATHLGNLYFSLGEFGALKARQAWEERLAIAAPFTGDVERLHFLRNLGTARQWSADRERAAQDLDSALALATRLDRPADRLELLARLALLASERDRPQEAQALLRQALALESEPGQRAILWRNLAMVQQELGEGAAAARSLDEAQREAGRGRWPLKPEQNWLTIKLIGIRIPIWNFPGLYTGQGRLDWGGQEEEALRQSLRDDMNGRQGALDLRTQGLHARRRLLRRQGDLDGMLRIDLALARQLAAQGRWESAVRRYQETARLAAEAVLAGAQTRALDGALACCLLGAQVEPDPAARQRLVEQGRQLREQLRLLLDGPEGALLPAESRLRLELGLLRALEAEAGRSGPVEAFLLRNQALLRLEDLENSQQRAGVAWSPRQKLGVDLAASRLLLATGEAGAAAERLEGWDASRLPAEAALGLAWARLQADRVAGKDARPALRDVRQGLEAVPAAPDQLLEVRRLDALARELAAAADPANSSRWEDWRAWWLGRRLWEQADPVFARESWNNAWRGWCADLAQLDHLLQARLDAPEAVPDSLLEQARQALARSRQLAEQQGPHLAGWLAADLEAAGRLPQWLASLPRVLSSDSLRAGHLAGAPAVLAQLASEPVLAGGEVALVGAPAAAALPSQVSVVPVDALFEGDHAGLDARVICLDGVLHPLPGAPQASWLELDGRRVPLRNLLGRDLPGETLVLGAVDWSAQSPEDWRDGWLALERLLAECGLRRLLVPGPGQELGGPALAEFGLGLAGDEPLALPAQWWEVGAGPRSREDRLADQRQGLEGQVALGNEYRKQGLHDEAWRCYRQALRLALLAGDQAAAARLLRLGAAEGLDGGRHGEALDVLLGAAGRLPADQVEWDKLGGRLVQLADLAGRFGQADSLWERLVLGGDVPGMPGAALGPLDPPAAALALESRLAALESRGARERAVQLARSNRVRPAGEDPRRALFLARLYLDADDAREAQACLDSPAVAWSRLDSLESLDGWELRALAAQRLGRLGAARAAMDSAAWLAGRLSLSPARRVLHGLRQADLAYQLGESGRCAALLAEARALLPAGELRLELLLENTQGLLETELDQPEEAAASFARAARLGLRLQDPLELSAVANNQARLAQRRGDWLEALESCRRAAEQDSVSRSPRRALGTLRNQSAALRGWLAAGQDAAVSGGRKERLEEMDRRLEAGGELAARLGDGRAGVRLALERSWLALELGRWELARALADSCATRAEREGYQAEAGEARWAGGRARIGQRREEEARGWLEEALVRVEAQAAERAKVGFDPSRGWLQRQLSDELVSLHGRAGRAWEALAAAERGRGLGLAEMLARRGGSMPRPADAAQLRRVLEEDLAPGQSLLGWHLGTRDGWLFRWEEGRLEIAALEASADSLRTLARLHHERLVGFVSVEPSGRQLAELLLPAPWRSRPPSRVHLLPPAGLSGLAFETLVLEDGSWLGQHCALSRSGSLAELDHATRLPGGSGPPLVFCDPLVAGQPPLEFTEYESGEVVRLFPGAGTLRGAQAGEAALKADALPRTFRHFACHAVHDPRSPAQSALLLAAGGGEDGRTGAAEIAAMTLPGDLALLSACETARGASEAESGAALPRAFLAAGTRAVVASLWKVDDLSTAVLVKHFYRSLEAGQPADLALAQAQDAVRRWVHGHPAYWAAFCLNGAARPAQAEAGPSTGRPEAVPAGGR